MFFFNFHGYANHENILQRKLQELWYMLCSHPNESSALLCFEHGNTIKIGNRMFYFSPGLPHKLYENPLIQLTTMRLAHALSITIPTN